MFWDSSAVVPLFLPEARSEFLAEMLANDAEAASWWATPVECLSAFYRRHRQTPFQDTALREALQRLEAFSEDVDLVAPTDPVRRRAGRLLAVHPLRAGDALQLAAALIWCEEQPEGEVFMCVDGRLAQAARTEGFDVRP